MEAPYFLPEHIFRDKCMYVTSLHLKKGAVCDGIKEYTVVRIIFWCLIIIMFCVSVI